jgi:glycolate oxidase
MFHAGDGNLHPLILFDNRSAEQTQKTIAAGREILEYCISVGGSITGEHGVGMEKMDMMDVLFTSADLEVMRRLKDVFNPTGVLNPQKVLPTTRMCRETVAPGHPSVAPEARA